jgi:predicted peptidase
MRRPTELIVRDQPLAHVIYVPAADPAGGLHPVLCFLHGLREAAPMPILQALKLHGPLNPDNSHNVADRFVVVAPQLPSPGGDVWHQRVAEVREMVEFVQAQYRGDPHRTYLTGFSYGGNGVFDIAIAEPQLWAAIWCVDPTRPPDRNLPCPLWLCLGDASRGKRADFIRTINRLREIGPGEEIPDDDFAYEDRGQDHVGTARLAYKEERIYKWLLERRRRQE